MVLLFFGVSCQNSKHENHFKLSGVSGLKIINNTLDSVGIDVSNWIYLPLHEEVIDTAVTPNGSLELLITTQSKNYFKVKIWDKEFRLFAVPNALNEIILSPDGDVRFEGALKEINEFLKTRSVDSDWISRTPWFQGRGTVFEVIEANDSITELQINAVIGYANLPSWYKEFEGTRLEYINAESKLKGIGYRKKMLSMNDSVPIGFLEKVTYGLEIENGNYVGVISYMRFIGWYLNYKTDPFQEKSYAKSKEQLMKSTASYIESINQNFSNQTIKEVFLASYLTGMIDRQRHIFNEEWLRYLSDPELSSLISEQLLTYPILPKGDKLPYFYLSDMDSLFFEPDDYLGKILVINFWATWCKPCYTEFEYEDKLVEKFKSEPVVVLNICIDSKYDKWKNVVSEYQLKTKNLFAAENWSEKINKDFGTSALPHSVLIDWEGKIVQNKCARPSAGMEEIIAAALLEMKNQASKDQE